MKTTIEIKGCPVCWGKGVICMGLKKNLDPILEPCTGCDGTGWIAFKTIGKNFFLIMVKEWTDLVMKVLKEKDSDNKEN